jgi:Family of unknown function (DUF5681)
MNDEKSETTTSSRALDSADDSGQVGYGRPPTHSRFKSGQSGNLRGRPRGARGKKKILEEILQETHSVIENGVRRRRSTFGLIILSLRNRAIEGNLRALRAVEHLGAKYAPQDGAEPDTLFLLPDNGRDSKQ